MKRATRFLIHLYPASWRRRYAAEFEALLAEVPATWRGFFNVLMGAFKMQLTTWNFSRIIVASSFAGLLIAGVWSLLVPDRYRSEAVIYMSGPNASEDVAREEVEVLSKTSLSGIIRELNLYPEDHAPMLELIDKLRRHVAVVPIRNANGSVPAFAIQFDDPDRHVAQRVTQALAAGFIDANAIPQPNGTRESGTLLQLLETPTLPFNPLGMSRVSISTIGLFSGTLLGLLMGTALWLRRRNHVAAFCPTCGQPITASPQISGESADRP